MVQQDLEDQLDPCFQESQSVLEDRWVPHFLLARVLPQFLVFLVGQEGLQSLLVQETLLLPFHLAFQAFQMRHHLQPYPDCL